MNDSGRRSAPVLTPLSGPLLGAEVLTAAFLLYLLGGGGRLELASHLYLSGLAGAAIWALSAAALRSNPTAPDSAGLAFWAARGRRGRPRLRSLEEVEHAVDFALTTAFDLHFRLRPHLVAVAGHRLAARGVSLELQPKAARSLLGEQLHDLVRPDCPPPQDRNARGIELAQLESAVAVLEAL